LRKKGLAKLGGCKYLPSNAALFYSYGSLRTVVNPWAARYLIEDEPTPYAHNHDTMWWFSAVLQNY
jgi:hypothetical protein